MRREDQAAQLHLAVRDGDLKSLSSILTDNPSLANARSPSDPRGTFPLHVAAEFGQAGTAQLLLDRGADVKLLDLTPLGCAVGGSQGRWRQFSNASAADWQQCAELIRAQGGVE